MTDSLILAWYGDDYTGSAAVMEVLAFAGIKAVLFLDPPSDADLREFPDAQAIGIAGSARSRSPQWMRAELPPIFHGLKRIGAAVTLYKVCSTLDSSPEIGSIGVAMDIALQQFSPAWVPILIAAPQIGRYQAFGNLFARAGDGIHRLDRHPIMSRHPVTPMTEADVAAHLARQTDLPIGCLMLTELADPGTAAGAAARLLSGGTRAMTLDAVDNAGLAAVGALIWRMRGQDAFCVGSQGVAYALVEHLVRSGHLDRRSGPVLTGATEQIAVVAGSVSATTAEQIAWAGRNGFALVPFDPASVVSDADGAAEVARVIAAAVAALSSGQSVLVHTALGPADPRIDACLATLAAEGLTAEQGNARLGTALGEVLENIRIATDLRRFAIAGGDTSSHALRALGLKALTALAETVPGAAICTGHLRAGGSIEIALKGGQMGSPDYFGRVRNGGPAPDAE